MKTKVFALFLIIIIGGILFINIAAAIPGAPPTPTVEKQNIGQLFDILLGALSWVYAIFFVIAAFFILFAAFTYLTAKGDPEKVKGARDQIIYAVIAIVVALLAFSIDKIVAAFISGQN